VAEGSGATLFMVRRGQLVTPPITSDILESITRTTLIDAVAPALGMEVVERDIARTELYVADEAFSAAAATRSPRSSRWTASRSATAASAPSPSGCSPPT